MFFLFCFLKCSSFCRGSENNARKISKIDHSHVKNWSNCVARCPWSNFWLMLGPIFTLKIWKIRYFLGVFDSCWNHYFTIFQYKFASLKPTPKIGTIFVNTTALTEKKTFWGAGVHFWFWEFLLFRSFDLFQWQKQKIKSKQLTKLTTRSKQETI